MTNSQSENARKLRKFREALKGKSQLRKFRDALEAKSHPKFREQDQPSKRKTAECILQDDFVRQCIERFQGRSKEELYQFIAQWDSAALRYCHWLEAEGFTRT
jgi:hypothetical protein